MFCLRNRVKNTQVRCNKSLLSCTITFGKKFDLLSRFLATNMLHKMRIFSRAFISLEPQSFALGELGVAVNRYTCQIRFQHW